MSVEYVYEFDVISSRALKTGDQLVFNINNRPAYAKVVPFDLNHDPVPSMAAMTNLDRDDLN